MILSHYTFDSPLDISEEGLNYLVIENQQYLSKYIEEMIMQIRGEPGRFRLSENWQEISIKDHVRMIVDPFIIDPNERGNLSNLYAQLAEISLDEEHYESSINLYSQIQVHIQELITDSGASATCMRDFDLISNFKSMDLKFDFGSETLLEKICDYIITCRDYGGASLFIFVNLRSFISDNEVSDIRSFITYNKIPVVLLEDELYDIEEGDCVKIIDSDLCEIDYSE